MPVRPVRVEGRHVLEGGGCLRESISLEEFERGRKRGQVGAWSLASQDEGIGGQFDLGPDERQRERVGGQLAVV